MLLHFALVLHFAAIITFCGVIVIIAKHVIRDLVSEIRGGFFSIKFDEYTDISNKEQLTICILWVDEELEAHEDFLGFYNVPDIGAETVVSAIKDLLLKLQLSSVNCRGQCYDGASNMMAHKTGVAKRIQDLQPKAYTTHCHELSLTLRHHKKTVSCYQTLWTQQKKSFPSLSFHQNEKISWGNKRKPRRP